MNEFLKNQEMTAFKTVILSERECMTCNVANHDLRIGILTAQNCSHLIIKI
jgi:hypothetical protein